MSDVSSEARTEYKVAISDCALYGVMKMGAAKFYAPIKMALQTKDTTHCMVVTILNDAYMQQVNKRRSK